MRPSLIAHGGWPFLITAAIGRLPAALIQLGLLMYVTGVGLGLGLGGMNVAAVGLGTAAGATLMGRIIDAVGPLPVVLVNTVVQVAGLFVIHLITPALVDGELNHVVMLAVAAVIGFVNPQVGPITRSHWSHLSRERGEPMLIRNALGYEGAMDEASFIVGPILAGLLVSTLGPTTALFTLMAIIVVGQGVFALYLFLDRAAWNHRPGSTTQPGSGRIPFAALIPPMAILLAVGMTFGTTQTALTALNDARGTQHLTGIIYGTVGIGSAFSSLLTPRLPVWISSGARMMIGAVGLILAALGFITLPGLWESLGIALVMGFAVGIILVTGFSRAEEVAPSSRIASVMTMLSMCLTLGVSIGAAITGQIADVLWRGFLPDLGAGILALAAGAFIVFSSHRLPPRGTIA